MEFQSIRPLLNAHEGEAAWIFGKGPSLDGFPMATAGPLRIVINESLRAVPGASYFFAHDEGPIRNIASHWPKGCRAILQAERARFARDQGVSEENIFVYTKCYCDADLLHQTAEELAKRRSLFGNSGTVHSAIHFCKLIGAARLTFVGFDGVGGYAHSIGLPDGGAEHARIRRDSVSLLNTLGLPYEFFSQVGTAEVETDPSPQ